MDYEKYLRIKESNEQKEKRKSDRAIKKLKKQGKVQSISGFLVCKEDVKDDDWTKSKKECFQRNRVNRRGATTGTALFAMTMMLQSSIVGMSCHTSRLALNLMIS